MSLQVWLPLNGDLHNQGLSDLSFTATSYNSVDNNGKIGQCYNNDAPSWNRGGFISDKAISLGVNQSMFAWVNFTTLNANSSLGGCLISQHNSSTNSGMGLNIRYITSTTGYITVSTGNGSTRTYATYYGTTVLEAGKWYHLGYTYDGSNIKLYVNGICEKTQAYTGMSVPENKIGLFGFSLSNNVGSYNLNGKMNDVRVYNHCLSPKEVEEISKGLILHYKFDDEYIESTKNIVPYPAPSNLNPSIAWDTTLHVDAIEVSNWTNGYNGGTTNPTVGYHAMWNIIDGIPTIVFQNHNRDYNMGNRWMGVRSDSVSEFIPAGAKYTISYEQKTIDTLGGWTTSGLYYKKTSSDSQNFHDGGVQKIGQNTKLNVWEKFSYTFTHNTAATNNSGNIGLVYIYGNNGSVDSTMLVRNVQLEIKDHSTPFTPGERDQSVLYDSSGYQHNGTIMGNFITTTSSARHSVATYQDDGLTNYIKTDSIYLPTDTCTMSVWIKSNNTAPTGNYHDPFCAYSTPASYELSIYKTGYLRAGLYISGTRKVDNCTSTKLLDGNWHMITMTYDGTTIKRYVDAVMEKSTTVEGTLTSPMNFAFGRYGSGTTYGSKEMSYSDARFYATALTQEQINELYNTSAAVDNNGDIYARELVE